MHANISAQLSSSWLSTTHTKREEAARLYRCLNDDWLVMGTAAAMAAALSPDELVALGALGTGVGDGATDTVSGALGVSCAAPAAEAGVVVVAARAVVTPFAGAAAVVPFEDIAGIEAEVRAEGVALDGLGGVEVEVEAGRLELEEELLLPLEERRRERERERERERRDRRPLRDRLRERRLLLPPELELDPAPPAALVGVTVEVVVVVAEVEVAVMYIGCSGADGCGCGAPSTCIAGSEPIGARNTPVGAAVAAAGKMADTTFGAATAAGFTVHLNSQVRRTNNRAKHHRNQNKAEPKTSEQHELQR
jgi:hypothetical protein